MRSLKSISTILIILIVLFTTCKKNQEEDLQGWNKEDKEAYDNAIELLDNANNNYASWSQSMDSLEAIEKLHQFYRSDPNVENVIVNSQGVSVLFKNGMIGGIFLNPRNGSETLEIDSITMPKQRYNSKLTSNKSFGMIKKKIWVNAIYWEYEPYHNMIADVNALLLPKIGFTLETKKNEDANLEAFTKLSGNGIIQISTHGYAYPNEKNIEEVYIITGEVANSLTSKTYLEDIKSKKIIIQSYKASDNTLKKFYFVSDDFIRKYNDFSNDTVLFYGSFCFGFLGQWPTITETFEKGTYISYDWATLVGYDWNWSSNFLATLTDISVEKPLNVQDWFKNPVPSKTYWYPDENRFVSILSSGDQSLVLWQEPTVLTLAATNVTENSASVGGNITKPGSSAVSVKGICWNTEQNPTLENFKTTEGSGIGQFVSNLTNLTPNTVYYARAYAENATGVAYGEQIQFTTTGGTLPQPPTVETAPVVNITPTNATSGGNVSAQGSAVVTSRGLCWSTSPNPTVTNNITQDGNGTGQYVSQMTNLLENTTYYVRAYATNSAGEGYGNQITFTTAAAGNPPVAAFNGDPTSGNAPLTVVFTDQSANNPTSWQWNFGDGTTSNVQNPGKIYQNAGSYSVQLTVTNSFGTDTETKTNYITVTASTGQACPGIPTVTDIDGNVYNTVLIGDQCWLKENLKTTKYRNGTNIAYPGNNNSAWENNTSGAYAWYDNDIIAKDLFGALYNWYAVINTNELCPTGWHVPSKSELEQLIDYSGGILNAGGKLKSTRTLPTPQPAWLAPNSGAVDQFNFSALPGGARARSGQFGYLSLRFYWWTSTNYQTYEAWWGSFSYDGTGAFYYGNGDKAMGRSVRCLKD